MSATPDRDGTPPTPEASLLEALARLPEADRQRLLRALGPGQPAGPEPGEGPAASLLGLARQVLALAGGELTVALPALGLTLTLGRAGEGRPAAEAGPGASAPPVRGGEPAGGWPPLKLRQVHRKLVAQATDQPVSPKRLIALAGYRYNAHTRGALAALYRSRHLERTPEGNVIRGPRPV